MEPFPITMTGLKALRPRHCYEKKEIIDNLFALYLFIRIFANS